MTISAETYMLVADIAFRMGDECDKAWKQHRDLPNNIAAGWLYCVAFEQSFLGIAIGMDAFEEDFAKFDRLPKRTLPWHE